MTEIPDEAEVLEESGTWTADAEGNVAKPTDEELAAGQEQGLTIDPEDDESGTDAYDPDLDTDDNSTGYEGDDDDAQGDEAEPVELDEAYDDE